MRVITKGRGEGKTQCLIEWAAEPEEPGRPRYICVADQWRAKDVALRAKESGFNIRFPVTYDEVLMHRGRRLELGVDDADELLRWVMRRHDVAVMTVTSDG